MDECRTSFLKFSEEKYLLFGREEVYRKLATLEIMGLKNSPEFKTQLKVLSFINETLREKINNNKCSTSDYCNACAHINNEYIEMECKDEESIMYKHDDLSYRYLFNLLFFKGIDKLEAKGAYDKIRVFSLRKYNRNLSKNMIDCYRYLDADINRVFLSMIQEGIDNSTNEELKKGLIESKYKLISLNDSMETEMEFSNFEVGRVIPLKSRFFISFFEPSKKKVDIVLNDLATRNILRNKDYILEYSDDGISLNELEITLRTYYMRANLFMVRKERISRENISYCHEVSNREDFDDYYKGDIIVADTYGKALKDKAKYRVLITK